jgi:hypothetical protein
MLMMIYDSEAKGVFVETALSDDGMLASDHRLVVADIAISWMENEK